MVWLILSAAREWGEGGTVPLIVVPSKGRSGLHLGGWRDAAAPQPGFGKSHPADDDEIISLHNTSGEQRLPSLLEDPAWLG